MGQRFEKIFHSQISNPIKNEQILHFCVTSRGVKAGKMSKEGWKMRYVVCKMNFVPTLWNPWFSSLPQPSKVLQWKWVTPSQQPNAMHFAQYDPLHLFVPLFESTHWLSSSYYSRPPIAEENILVRHLCSLKKDLLICISAGNEKLEKWCPVLVPKWESRRDLIQLAKGPAKEANQICAQQAPKISVY